MKITVVARAQRNGWEESGRYMTLTPLIQPSRRQSICRVGIFNLMGIKKPGRYTIECKEVVKKAARRKK